MKAELSGQKKTEVQYISTVFMCPKKVELDGFGTQRRCLVAFGDT
jgi:hypothetical protein